MVILSHQHCGSEEVIDVENLGLRSSNASKYLGQSCWIEILGLRSLDPMKMLYFESKSLEVLEYDENPDKCLELRLCLGGNAFKYLGKSFESKKKE